MPCDSVLLRFLRARECNLDKVCVCFYLSLYLLTTGEIYKSKKIAKLIKKRRLYNDCKRTKTLWSLRMVYLKILTRKHVPCSAELIIQKLYLKVITAYFFWLPFISMDLYKS